MDPVNACTFKKKLKDVFSIETNNFDRFYKELQLLMYTAIIKLSASQINLAFIKDLLSLNHSNFKFHISISGIHELHKSIIEVILTILIKNNIHVDINSIIIYLVNKSKVISNLTDNEIYIETKKSFNILAKYLSLKYSKKFYNSKSSSSKFK